MVSSMVKDITGSYVIPFAAEEGTEPVMIDFSPPWKRISMMSGLEEEMGVKFPPMDSPDLAEFLNQQCIKHNVECRAPRTVARLIDKLVGHFLESKLINPAFIMDHPEIMSPLAKSHRSIPGLTERFELFVATRELCNAYTELNMPVVQRQRFAEQAKAGAEGDDEAQVRYKLHVICIVFGRWRCGSERRIKCMARLQHWLQRAHKLKSRHYFYYKIVVMAFTPCCAVHLLIHRLFFYAKHL